LRLEILILIIGVALATYITRVTMLVGLSGRSLPPWLLAFLRYIPVAILAALLTPSIFAPEGEIIFSLHNPYLLAAIPTLIIAYYGKNLMLTILSGILFMVVINFIL